MTISMRVTMVIITGSSISLSLSISISMAITTISMMIISRGSISFPLSISVSMTIHESIHGDSSQAQHQLQLQHWLQLLSFHSRSHDDHSHHNHDGNILAQLQLLQGGQGKQ